MTSPFAFVSRVLFPVDLRFYFDPVKTNRVQDLTALQHFSNLWAGNCSKFLVISRMDEIIPQVIVKKLCERE